MRRNDSLLAISTNERPHGRRPAELAAGHTPRENADQKSFDITFKKEKRQAADRLAPDVASSSLGRSGRRLHGCGLLRDTMLAQFAHEQDTAPIVRAHDRADYRIGYARQQRLPVAGVTLV